MSTKMEILFFILFVVNLIKIICLRQKFRNLFIAAILLALGLALGQISL